MVTQSFSLKWEYIYLKDRIDINTWTEYRLQIDRCLLRFYAWFDNQYFLHGWLQYSSHFFHFSAVTNGWYSMGYLLIYINVHLNYLNANGDLCILYSRLIHFHGTTNQDPSGPFY